MSAIFELHQVRQSFGKRTVLEVPQLFIKPGECLGVIGPSGAGKTTLLRILALLDRPASGEMIYAGKKLNGAIPIETRREVTMVFQRAALLDKTVYENVEYGLAIRGVEDTQRVRDMLEVLGIAHLASQPAFSLSGGELQRAAVARALVIRPRVLLLDEPTANLDPENVSILENAIKRTITDDGTTVVLVSHNLHQIERLATNVAGVLDGEVVEHGPVQDVVHNATNPKLRTFVSGGISR